MRKNIFLMLLLFALIAAATSLLDYRIKPIVEVTDSMAPSEKIEPKTAPDFSFTDIKNHTYHLSDFKGKIVILHFWASWCAPCVHEFPKLIKTANDKIIVLAVSSDETQDAMRRFVTKTTLQASKNKNLYITWDKDRAITHDLYQTFAYPETIVIDEQGRMIRKIPGDADWAGEDMKSYLKTLIAPLAKAPVKP